MTARTYYHVLNVSPRASDEEVRQAYRALALRWHPDRNPLNRARAQKNFIAVSRAYTILKTKPQREAYNRVLLAARRQAVPAVKKTRKSNLFFRFFSALREIFWPFTLNREARHG